MDFLVLVSSSISCHLTFVCVTSPCNQVVAVAQLEALLLVLLLLLW